MGKDKTLSQVEAWKTYDRWLNNDRVSFVGEPPDVEAHFRSLSNHNWPAPKDWADAYLAAFAYAADLTLVSFDKSFRSKLKNVQLLST